jgi:hypothetical protein
MRTDYEKTGLYAVFDHSHGGHPTCKPVLSDRTSCTTRRQAVQMLWAINCCDRTRRARSTCWVGWIEHACDTFSVVRISHPTRMKNLVVRDVWD